MKRYLRLENIGRLITMTNKGRGELGVIENACCLIKQGKIECAGDVCELPEIEDYLIQRLDVKGAVVMPGLVDCHTHLVHGGWRALEAADRARGVTYEEIAKAGGGILSTVHATRDASFEELCDSAKFRANEAFLKGVTTIEVKSGYGLDLETELKMLKVVYWLNKNHPITFVPTFLGAHTIPADYQTNRRKYIDLIIDEMIPRVADEGLAEFCDVFVENIAFTKDEAREILEVGLKHGLKPKIHADQLTNSGGAMLAAEIGAVSADHLEHTPDDAISAMAEKKVTGVMLPGSTFYLGQTDFAPAKKFLRAGVNLAISTDYNPGTTPNIDLFLTATIAMSRLKLSIEDCLRGITLNAARALSLEKKGVIEVGADADLIVLDCPNEYYPIYRYGSSSLKYIIKDGRIAYDRKS